MFSSASSASSSSIIKVSTTEKGQPLLRVGTSEEVSYLMAYLASDESNSTTGTTQVIDGGTTISAGDISATTGD